MKLVLVLNVLIASAAALDTAVDNGNIRLRGGGRDLKGHKGPKPLNQSSGVPMKSDLLKGASSRAVDEESTTIDDGHNFRMAVKNAKKNGRKHAQVAETAPAPAPEDVPPPALAVEEEVDVPEGVPEVLSTEVKVDPDLEFPIEIEVEGDGVSPTQPSEPVDDMSATDSTKKMKKKDRKKDRVRKGHDKKERVKKDHSKKEKTHTMKGGRGVDGDLSMVTKMKPTHKKTSDLGKNKKSKPVMSMTDGDGMEVDAKADKKKMKKMKKERKHKKQHMDEVHGEEEGETPSTVTPYTTVSPDYGAQSAQTTPVSVVEKVNPAPLSTPAPTSEPTPVPTPAPSDPPIAQVVTSAPTTKAPTDAPTEEQWPTYAPSAGPPDCPPAYDSSITNQSPTEEQYAAGEWAEVQGHIFECHPDHVFYCNEPDWHDGLLATNPNAQQDWNDAWVHRGPCIAAVAGLELMSGEIEVETADADAVVAPEWESYELSDDCLLKYKLSDAGDSVSMEVIHDGVDPVWLGLAFSRTGQMVGSEAVM